MEFRVLGQVEVLRRGRPLQLGGVKRCATAAALLLDANRAVTIDRLTEALWVAPPPAAESNVRTYIASLRNTLAAAGEARTRLFTSAAGYRLEVLPGELDLNVFEESVADGERALADGDTATAARRLRHALDLWRGPALTGLTNGPYLTAEAERLERRRLQAADLWAQAALAEGQHDRVAAVLEPLVRAQPLWEGLRGHLMLALYRCGRQSAALAEYLDAYQVLDRELGVAPCQSLQRLHQRILDADPDLALTKPAAVTVPTPRQLPADVPVFVGRTDYLQRLDEVFGPDGEPPNATVTAVVTGTAGVGKTALVVHWAQQAAERFPGGQLYVDLCGFAPCGSVMSPSDAIRGFLDALGVPPDRIPQSPSAQSAMYRTLVAGRRLLVVLDNARDAGQVRPLLPGTPGCVVVVTSRNRLTGLVATEGAHLITLKLPPHAEAGALLTGRLSRARTANDPASVEEVVTRCARLPLALAIISARAAARPDFPLTSIAEELRAADGDLGSFVGDGDPVTDIRAVFSWSYRALPASAARLFRLLGLHPGPDISAAAAASLAGVCPQEVRPLLAALTDANLVHEHRPGRYSMHNLLRAYAVELVHNVDAELDRRGALDRMLGHYAYSAHAAALSMDSIRETTTLSPLPAGVTPERPAGRSQALRWFKSEQQVVQAIGHLAGVHRLDEWSSGLKSVRNGVRCSGHGR